MSRHATHGERHQWPSHVGPPRACERRRWPSDVALQAFARRREEEKGACELKNKGPTRCCYRRPCVPPPQGPTRCAAAPRALLIAPPPRRSCTSRHRPTGPARHAAAPWALRIAPPPHGPCSSHHRPVGPTRRTAAAHRAAAPRAQVHHVLATSPLLEEKGKVSIEKRN
jgi:hypothetical protein